MSASSAADVRVQSTDMPDDMQQDAIDSALLAFQKQSCENDIAAYITKDFDKKYSPTWHCIVGRSFGSRVIHETNSFIFFYVGAVAVLLFKTQKTSN